MNTPATASRRPLVAAPSPKRRLSQVERYELALLIAGLILIAYQSLHIGDWRKWDVSEYHSYALGFWTHWPPQLPVEYPPLSIIPFSLTLLDPFGKYPIMFAFWMGLLVVGGYLAFRSLATPLKARAYAVYLLGAGAGTLLLRFDLVPALVTVAALWLLQRRRFRAVYLLLAAGALLKLFPLALLPVAAIAQWHDGRERGLDPRREIALGVGICLAIVGAGFGVALLLDPINGLGTFTYGLHRPVQLESVPATALWFGSLLGVPATTDNTFKSFNLLSDLSGPTTAIFTLALVAGSLWVFWRQFRGQLATGHAAIGVLLVILCTSKVFSAQYLIWMAPLLAAVFGLELRWLALCLLTALVYPVLYQADIHYPHPYVKDSFSYGPFLMAGLAVRNVLLVVLTASTILMPAAGAAADRISGAVVRPVRSPQAPARESQPSTGVAASGGSRRRARRFDDVS